MKAKTLQKEKHGDFEAFTENKCSWSKETEGMEIDEAERLVASGPEGYYRSYYYKNACLYHMNIEKPLKSLGFRMA